MWQVGRPLAGGTGALQNPVPNINQGNNEDSDSQAKPHGIIILAFAMDGKFTKACLHLGVKQKPGQSGRDNLQVVYSLVLWRHTSESP